jgi:hypothetical protein
MDKKHIKYLVIAIIGLVSFGSLIYFNYVILPNLEPPKTEESENSLLVYFNGIPRQEVSNITLFINYNGAKTNELHQNINLTNGQTTVYHALISRCIVDVRWYGTQIYINKINGIGEGWIYTVNGFSPNTACNFYNLNNNDVITWKYVGS